MNLRLKHIEIHIKISAISCLILLILVGCKESIKQSSDFQVSFPDTTHKMNNIEYQHYNNLSQELGLEKITVPTDSLILRLWYRPEGSNGGQLIQICYNKKEWIGKFYSYVESTLFKDPEKDFKELSFLSNIVVDSFLMKKMAPVSGWDSFINALTERGYEKLIHQENISSWKNKVVDGDMYRIEFANKKLYRAYWYSNPDVYAKDFIDCNKMTVILELFKKEMDFPYSSGTWSRAQFMNEN